MTVENKKEWAIRAGIAVGAAGVTILALRAGNSLAVDNGIGVIAKRVVMHNVNYIAANRQGPPSWVVRCLETGSIFTSQNAAATEMGLSAAHLSQHLNGLRDHVSGNHFERICLAA